MAKKRNAAGDNDSQRWTFLSNHTFVMICIAQDPEMRLRDVATVVGITERAVQRIIADLESGGYLSRIREGRRNRYELHLKEPLNHPLSENCTLDELLSLFTKPSQAKKSRARPKRAAKKKPTKKRATKKRGRSRS